MTVQILGKRSDGAPLRTGTGTGRRGARVGSQRRSLSTTARRSAASTSRPPALPRRCRRLPADPAPGTYYASPALASLLRSVPAGQLADRYPGRLAGIIGDAALPSPNSLVIVVGRTPAQLATTVGSVKVTAIATVPGNLGGNVTSSPAGNGHRPRFPPNYNPNGLRYVPADTGIPASGTDLILSVVALAILLPVLIFIGTATRLSAARREERFAAMRLAGATRTQVSALAAVESTAAAVAGVAAGFAVFFGLRIPVAGIPFVGQPFFPGQLTLSASDVIVVAAGVPAAAAVAARLALRRVNISPLGVTRRVTPKPPGVWQVVPLLLGLAELGFWAAHGHPASIQGQIQAFATSFALIIIGLFIAGPWLTMAAARLMARWTSRPGTLIAARRIGDDPRAAFRSVSGLVLALLVTTVATIAITTQDAKDPTRFGSIAESHVLTAQISASNAVGQGSAPGARSGTANPGPAAPAAPLAARLNAVPGVQGVLVVRAVPGLTIPGRFENLGVNPFGDDGSVTPIPAGVVSCAQLATVPALGRCPAGAATAEFPADGFNGPLGFNSNVDTYTWPAANVPAASLSARGVDGINVATNGATATVEQARTLLEASVYPALSPPSTYADIAAQDNLQNSGYQQLANVVILVSLAVAGCTLAAGIAAGLAERKRPFSLLRLAGARLSTLRGVVALEGAVPLLTVAAVAVGTGFGAAAMYAAEAQSRPMAAPGPAYYLLTAGGIIVSLAIIAATFPVLTRITGPEAARND